MAVGAMACRRASGAHAHANSGTSGSDLAVRARLVARHSAWMIWCTRVALIPAARPISRVLFPFS
jgi:hypothetical protein